MCIWPHEEYEVGQVNTLGNVQAMRVDKPSAKQPAPTKMGAGVMTQKNASPPL